MISIKNTQIGDVCIFEIDGRLDSMSATKFQSTVLHAAYTHTCQNIILDMKAVDYLSAAGLRVLGELKEATGVAYIADPSQRVRDVLQITGLDILYQVYETVTDALHQIQPVTNGYIRLEEGWLTHYAPTITGIPYLDWLRQGTESEIQDEELHEQYAMTAIASGLRTMIANGTTSILDISKDGKSIIPIARSALRGAVFIEVEGTHPDTVEVAYNQIRMLIERYRPRASKHLQIGIALAGLHAVHPELITLIAGYAQKQQIPIAISLAQTAAEVDFIQTGEGNLLRDFYNASRPPIPAPRKALTDYMQDLGLLALKPLILHGTHLTTTDIDRLAQADCGIVHTPRNDIRLRNGRMPLEYMLENNMRVCLGTGSLARVPDYDIIHDVEIAIALHYGKVAPEAIAALVGNPLPLPTLKP